MGGGVPNVWHPFPKATETICPRHPTTRQTIDPSEMCTLPLCAAGGTYSPILTAFLSSLSLPRVYFLFYLFIYLLLRFNNKIVKVITWLPLGYSFPPGFQSKINWGPPFSPHNVIFGWTNGGIFKSYPWVDLGTSGLLVKQSSCSCVFEPQDARLLWQVKKFMLSDQGRHISPNYPGKRDVMILEFDHSSWRPEPLHHIDILLQAS